jgi:hypothetical protein
MSFGVTLLARCLRQAIVDTSALAAMTRNAAEGAIAAYDRALDPKKLLTVPGSHYAVYGEQFHQTSEAAREWFVFHLLD